MPHISTIRFALWLAAPALLAAEAPINRHAVVTRHNVEWNELRGLIPGDGSWTVQWGGLKKAP